MPKRTTVRRLALASVFVAAMLVAAAQAQVLCVPWSQARDVIKKNGLRSTQSLRQIARSRFQGKMIRADLCNEGGGWVYRMLVRDKRGNVRNVTLNARSGGY